MLNFRFRPTNLGLKPPNVKLITLYKLLRGDFVTYFNFTRSMVYLFAVLKTIPFRKYLSPNKPHACSKISGSNPNIDRNVQKYALSAQKNETFAHFFTPITSCPLPRVKDYRLFINFAKNR
jgi:hypothetical protein